VIAQLDQAIRRALDPDRERRPASARAFAAELKRAIEACGDPMSATEIQAHVANWLEPNLARRSRDLAALVGRVRDQRAPDEEDEPATVPVEARPTVDGVRLRDVSFVVQDQQGPTTEELDAAPTLENVTATSVPAFETQVDPVTVPMPSTPMRPPAARAEAPPQPLLPPGQVTVRLPPVVEPEPTHSWVPHIVVALVAIVIGVIAAFFLS
jgi:hypothetical protein